MSVLINFQGLFWKEEGSSSLVFSWLGVFFNNILYNKIFLYNNSYNIVLGFAKYMFAITLESKIRQFINFYIIGSNEIFESFFRYLNYLL